MKTKFFAITLFAASALSASASFSLDFTGLNFSNTIEFSPADPLVVGVQGFGNVLFSTGGPTGTVDQSLGGPAAVLESSNPIILTFISGSPIENVVLTFIGQDGGEIIGFTQPDPTQVNPSMEVTLSDGVVGLSQVEFDRIGPKVPEPSVSLLGGLGLLALLRRRR